MLSRFKQQTKWLLLVVGLFSLQQSFAFKNNLTRPIAGAEGSEARIEEGSLLFQANCASCHALNNKVVGPALAGVIDKYDEDYEWLNAWIKNNQKLIKSGDARAKANKNKERRFKGPRNPCGYFFWVYLFDMCLFLGKFAG